MKNALLTSKVAKRYAAPRKLFPKKRTEIRSLYRAVLTLPGGERRFNIGRCAARTRCAGAVLIKRRGNALASTNVTLSAGTLSAKFPDWKIAFSAQVQGDSFRR